jgi:hypothetical protein
MPRDPSKFIAPDLVNSRCTECGAKVPDEFSSCLELFMSILTPLGSKREEHPDLAALHHLIVDTGALQHPQLGCKSAKSYAAHLTGLCCGLEYKGSQLVRAALQRWLNGSAEDIGINRPTEPDYRGSLTIRYVYDAETDEELYTRAHEWASQVWEAYSSQHAIARDWIKKAMGD